MLYRIRIASITKVFTDLMLMYLRDKGVVQLDDPLVKYMTKFQVRDPFHSNRYGMIIIYL